MKYAPIWELEDSPLGWVSVPKTGTQKLQITRFPKKYILNNENPQHLPTSIIQKTAGVDIPLFSVLRNPYDRNCSEYHYLKRNAQDIYGPDITNKNTLSAYRIVADRVKGFKPVFPRVYAIFYYDMSIEDYLEWCVHNPTYPLYFDTDKTPKDFEIIGLTEHLDKTIDLLKAMYDINAGKGPPNENTEKPIGKPYETKYSRSDYEKACAVDYEFYYESQDRFRYLSNKYLDSKS